MSSDKQWSSPIYENQALFPILCFGNEALHHIGLKEKTPDSYASNELTSNHYHNPFSLVNDLLIIKMPDLGLFIYRQFRKSCIC